ncbi:uncharacterized protein DMAD_13555 [Drosophila madeirensis]|uniref:Uncharacterized protein n=1 Tax=Drosophila madeirensis TaxID=30013 RepID=A0AAU9FKM5_DROMD
MDQTRDGWKTIIMCVEENSHNTQIAAEHEPDVDRSFDLYLHLGDSTTKMLESPRCPRNVRLPLPSDMRRSNDEEEEEPGEDAAQGQDVAHGQENPQPEL